MHVGSLLSALNFWHAGGSLQFGRYSGQKFFQPGPPTASLKAAKFHRDFDAFPLKVEFRGERQPDRFAVLPDSHADDGRLFPLLRNNGVIRERPDGPGQSGRCGSMEQSAWGSFHWQNPWEWSAGDLLLLSLGDIIDKGPNNLKVICASFDWKAQAAEAGGKFLLLAGNHESEAAKNCENTKTRGPGGVMWEVEGYGMTCEQFFGPGSPFGEELNNRPIIAQIGEDTVAMHGGLCPSDRPLDEELEEIKKEMREDGFGAPLLQSENALTRCRTQHGHKGEVTFGNVTYVIYGHDPEHEPRGKASTFCYQAKGQKLFCYWRVDSGSSRYINYSEGEILFFTRNGSRYDAQSCNALGQCIDLSPNPPAGPTLLAPLALPDAARGRNLGNPGRGPRHGVDRNFTAYPAIETIERATGDLYVLPDVLGAYAALRAMLHRVGLVTPEPHRAPARWPIGNVVLAAVAKMRAMLHRMGLVAAESDRAPARWTGGNAVVVAPGNLFGKGYFNAACLDLFRELDLQAKRENGRMLALLGAKEVDFRRDPNNDDTWAGGGIAADILKDGLWPEEVSTHWKARWDWLTNLPFGLRIFDVLVLSGGQTSNRNWVDMGNDLATAISLDGFDAELVSGPNSVTKKVNFAGRDGKQGPTLAEAANVTTIIHSLAPSEYITAYGHNSLVLANNPLNPWRGGRGEILRIRPTKNKLLYDAFDLKGKRRRVASIPLNPRRAL